MSDTETMAQSSQKGEKRINEEAYYAQSLYVAIRSYTFSNTHNPIPPVCHSYKPTEPQSLRPPQATADPPGPGHWNRLLHFAPMTRLPRQFRVLGSAWSRNIDT